MGLSDRLAKNRLTRYLSEALILEESGFGWNFRLALLGSVTIFILAIVLASRVKVNEAVVAHGQFRPQSHVHKVQPSEGGIIEEIPVREGDLVDKGALLLRLKNATTSTNQEQTERRLAGLLARSARLLAYLNGTPADFSAIDPKYKDLLEDQSALLRVQNQSRQAGHWVFTTQEEQKRSEIAQIQEEIKSARNRSGVNESLLTLQEKLAEKNLVSRMTQLEAKRTLLTSTGEIRSLEVRLGKARSALQEVVLKRKAFEDDITTQASQELSNVNSDIAQTRELLARLADRQQRLEVRSPIRGRIQNLRFRSIGAVVGVGDLVLQVIPDNDDLILDLNISTRDIGFVHPGQEVVIRVTSFDFARYGSVAGGLVAISPFTYMDAEKQVYYKGTVQPKSRTVSHAGQHYKILPGMGADAEIITGNRSLLEYLLKPLLSPLSATVAGSS
ncbi:MAG: HlyD family type I secretion periplasmic adaptor subunit [Magnetococcus sp. DMHC-1]|nr:HlyD family type I secretion periplasmic adaptor subunit [Magnetococcales bacterium]